MTTYIDNVYTPPIVPRRVNKTQGFTFLPPGTILKHDGGRWALYYYADGNMSYMVYDRRTYWETKQILGRVRISYAQIQAGDQPCDQEG